jgi:hypothetical protein
MQRKELNILKEWLAMIMFLIGAMILLLMGNLAILSCLLVVFIVGIRESAGPIVIKVKDYVLLNTPEVLTTWFKYLKNLKSKR